MRRWANTLQMDPDERRSRFHELHRSGTFIMPNPHDVGSCRLLTALGFEAVATTSSGFAASLGHRDMTLPRDVLVEHVRALSACTDLPLNVDAERCFPESQGGIEQTVDLLAEAGASGCSIEDWNPSAGRIEPFDDAVAAVATAASAARRHGLVLTARAEGHLRGRDDLDDTVARLIAFRAAGADVVYAPGLVQLTDITRVVTEAGAPVNVLLFPGGPTRDELAGVGVRRLSVGGAFTRIAYGALVNAAETLKATGVLGPLSPYLPRDLAERAFGGDPA
jgi:2-methylisocitrate lyase-like PEP mutase family enzyme